MLKIMAPAALVVACLSAVPAEARICPVGQMFRITLGICVAKTGSNVKWLYRTSSPAPVKHVVKAKAEPKPAKVARVAPLKVKPLVKPVEALSIAPEPPAPPDTTVLDPLVEAPSPSQSQSQTTSPYGVLRSNLF